VNTDKSEEPAKIFQDMGKRKCGGNRGTVADLSAHFCASVVGEMDCIVRIVLRTGKT
jgi:hypothetical protein